MKEQPFWQQKGDLFYRLGLFYRQEFGGPVRKICVDAGLPCPNVSPNGQGGCIFCNTVSFSQIRRNSLQKDVLQPIPRQVSEQIRHGKRHSPQTKYLVYFQPSTNTNAPVERLRRLYEEAISHPDVVGLIIGTRPDAVPDTVLDLLSDLAEKTWLMLEIGLQSVHNDTLRWLNRGHDYQTFLAAAERISLRNIRFGVHLILGLPGEDQAERIETAVRIAGLPIHSVKLHHLYICENTKIAEYYRSGCVELPSFADYCRYVVDFLERQPPMRVIDRIVSDTSDETLIAPDWMKNRAISKNRVIDAVTAEFRRRDSYQGKLFQREKE
jgi:radical SAM protein (TIGR01212 family)